jgi:GNAT superfamily N-acetyltransferase
MTRITSDPSAIDLRLAHSWIASTYWSRNIPWARFERACNRSLIFAAFYGDAQVGFARVVSDCATFAWLCDVFVAEHMRNKGVGRRMMEAVMADERLQGLRQFILATRDAHGLYKKLGFESLGEPENRFMRIFHPPSEIYGDSAPP